ncbi:pro-sigmaK processing inhibitor BofA family protein [Bacillus shivajii]|uniref:pro-sigmaK processing inhibitor BofA family protein n=1 Tax=Bacillus shivajii TaxID=1983719 RepID=UPI001CFBEDA2|nr:pro-sigmaK processing inhibitor BofA family protein [Bacillus shivajii]UCZ53285.1 pro-sigmaK processing inhibitor BofA family protein [Bacillus shivajii]
MEPVLVISLLGSLIFLLLILGAPMKPLRWIGQGAVRLLIGALLLFFLNAFGTLLGYSLPINLFTAAVSGFLGVPGIVALIFADVLLIP